MKTGWPLPLQPGAALGPQQGRWAGSSATGAEAVPVLRHTCPPALETRSAR